MPRPRRRTVVRLLTAIARAQTTPTTASPRVYRELRDEGQRERLLPLLNHADVAVRAWTAAHALEFAPDEGERVLEEIATIDQGILGFDAQQTLSVWREGGLSFP
jgi:Domain of unknown function (DUF2019)